MPSHFKRSLPPDDGTKIRPKHVEVDETYSGADKSLVRPISRCVLLDGENNSFDASHIYKQC